MTLINQHARTIVCTNKAPFDRLGFLIRFNHILTDAIDFGLFHKLSLTLKQTFLSYIAVVKMKLSLAACRVTTLDILKAI